VLVADDNADMRQYIAGLLAASYEVTVVNDGRAAWHAIQTTAPDLILCDVMMPHMDGFALLRAVRGDTAVRAIPVVLLSARAGEESRVEGLERGADDYLIKPFSARELLARVGAHIEISRVRRETEEALRLADRRKDEFLAMLAHELRNPLAPIRTGLELLRRSGDTPEGVARVRQMMERQVAHIVRLLDDLLDVSRITSGKIHLQREPMAVALGIHSAVEANRSAIAAKEIDLVVSLPPYPCVVDVDPTRFVQILSNLLHNATKFTERGGVIRVSVEVADTGAVPHVEIVVADSGIGISADLLPRVFDLFTQGDAPAPQPGLGIGLALAKRLVDMHGGTLVVKSDGRGKGSEFIVRMPCATSAFDGERPGHVVETQLDCRVLVIDDNRDAADVTALLVQSLGGDARVAYDGPTGLASALEFRPDLVLVDIRRPGLDGYEVCRRIRHVLGDGVALVALTGFGQASDRQEALRAGFDAHLTKPADPGVLATLVARYRRGDTREQTELRT
jgi:signal transduction histidine kinase